MLTSLLLVQLIQNNIVVVFRLDAGRWGEAGREGGHRWGEAGREGRPAGGVRLGGRGGGRRWGEAGREGRGAQVG